MVCLGGGCADGADGGTTAEEGGTSHRYENIQMLKCSNIQRDMYVGIFENVLVYWTETSPCIDYIIYNIRPSSVCSLCDVW